MKAIIKIWSSLTHSKAVKHPTKNIWETLRKEGRKAKAKVRDLGVILDDHVGFQSIREMNDLDDVSHVYFPIIRNKNRQ